MSSSAQSSAARQILARLKTAELRSAGQMRTSAPKQVVMIYEPVLPAVAVFAAGLSVSILRILRRRSAGVNGF